MKCPLYIAAFAALAVPALAQQPQVSPSQVALQIDNVINQWAQTIEAQQREIVMLQKELADLKAKQPVAPPAKK
jgi:cell division protein FtsL